MRIGINCYHLQKNIGGIKQYFVTLVRHLLANDDHEYVFFYFSRNAEELSKIISLESRQAVLLTSQSEIRKFLSGIDLYFCPFGSLSPRPLPLPSVVTLVDIQEVFYPEFFSFYGLLARAYHYQGSTKMADRVITISQFSKKCIVDHHGIPDEKVMVAYLCADERFYRAPLIARQPSRLLPQKYIFFPANYWQHKNHDLLLQAIRKIKVENNIEIHLVLTGFFQKNGYPLDEKVVEYGLVDQVHQMGYVAVEELAFIYLHAHFMVFPSLFEGFGIPLVEAMAVGCPVLAANSTSLTEIGHDSVCFFDSSSVEDLSRKILMLYDNEELLETLIVKGRQRAQFFSVARMASVHLEAFEMARQRYTYGNYFRLRWWYKYSYLISFLLNFFLNLVRRRG